MRNSWPRPDREAPRKRLRNSDIICGMDHLARPRQVQGTVCCRLRLCTPGAGVGRSTAYTLRDAPDRRDAKKPEGLTSALRTHPESPASRPVACCSGAAGPLPDRDVAGLLSGLLL